MGRLELIKGEGKKDEAKCVISMGEIKQTLSEFFVVGITMNPAQPVVMFTQGDVFTAGVAKEIIGQYFEMLYDELTEEQQKYYHEAMDQFREAVLNNGQDQGLDT